MEPPDNPPSDLAPRSRRDPWQSLTSQTPARIALGRAGGSLRTESLLELRLAHAGARDAVHAAFDAADMEASLRDLGLATERLATAASDRMTYLARPDLGRMLSPESEKLLHSRASSWGRRDLVILVSDGLSATAAVGNAAKTVGELVRTLAASGWTHYPVMVVPFARVKLQDSVGALLGARHSVILLGERPGLSAHDSLGAYLTFDPGAKRTDADRNCVSNIREGGLPAPAAARKLAAMLVESRRIGLSGTALRDADGEQHPELQPGPRRFS